MKQSKRFALLAVAVIGVAISVSEAAVVTMTRSNSASGESWNTLSVGGVYTWSDHLTAHSGDDYFVGQSAPGTPYTVRKPAIAFDSTFPGDSLTLSGGQLNLATASSTNGVKAIIDDLRVENGGVIVNGNPSSSLGLAGNLAFSGQGWVRTGGTDVTTNARNIDITSTITGSGIVGIAQGGTVSLNGVGNTFSGTWIVGGTSLGIPGATNSATDTTSTKYPNFRPQSAGSLGVDSSVELKAYARFNVDYDWTTAGSLTIDGSSLVTLDQNLSVGSLTIAGVSYGAGTYSFATLNAAHNATFDDIGSGAITVVPEPASLAALGLAAMALVRRRQA